MNTDISKYSFYIRIGIGLLIAFLISHFLVSEIFVGYSPQVRDDLPQYALLRIGDTVEGARSALFGTQENRTKPTVAGLKQRLRQVAPGVRASEIGNAQYTQYDLETVEWKKKEFVLSSGQRVVIHVPAKEKLAPPVEALR